MTEYLKQAPVYSQAVTDEVRRTVSEMLLRIDREGEAAIRHYSRTLDSWDPPRFTIGPDEISAARSAVSDQLKEHIEFAQTQVRTFATAQRETLTDLEVESLPGVVLGHRHIPVGTSVPTSPGVAIRCWPRRS